MGKIFTPQDIQSGFNTTGSLNDNFAQIEYALDACLARTGDAPNNMLADLDMDSYDIINVGTVHTDNLLIDNQQIPSVQDIVDAFSQGQGDIDDAVVAAEAAQAAAETAQGEAETAQAAAESARDDAEAAAAGVNLPSINPGDEGKVLAVNSAEDGYELTDLSGQDPAAGFIDVGTRQVLREVLNDDTYSYEITSFVTEDTQETVGATGSGADNIASVFDDIPSYAKGVILGYNIGGTSTAAGSFSIQFTVGSASATVSNASDITAGFDVEAAGASSVNSIKGHNLVVPFDSEGDLKIAVEYNTVNAATADITFYLNGYVY